MILKGFKRIMRDFYKDSKLVVERDSIEIRRDSKGFLKGSYRIGFYRISKMILTMILKEFTWML